MLRRHYLARVVRRRPAAIVLRVERRALLVHALGNDWHREQRAFLASVLQALAFSSRGASPRGGFGAPRSEAARGPVPRLGARLARCLERVGGGLVHHPPHDGLLAQHAVLAPQHRDLLGVEARKMGDFGAASQQH